MKHRRLILVVVFGLVLNIVLGIGVSFLLIQLVRMDPFAEPSLAIRILSLVISYIPLFASCFTVGFLMKDKGATYGAYFGVSLVVLSLLVSASVAMLPPPVIFGPEYTKSMALSVIQKNILNQLFHAPITIVLAALGGWIGSFFRKGNARNN